MEFEALLITERPLQYTAEIINGSTSNQLAPNLIIASAFFKQMLHNCEDEN